MDFRTRPVVLDGGLSNQLADAGHDLGGSLWSARLLLDEPEAIVAAHEAYFRAGARIATTASYQVSFEGFAAAGIGAAKTAEALRRSVELAREAAARVGEGLRVAASVGPYGAITADGAEYRGRYGLTAAELTAFHRKRLDVLVAAEPDFLAVETIPGVDEAVVLAELVGEYDVPAWLSYTVDGARTRAGQPLADAFAVAAGVDRIFATGVNCSSPDDTGTAIGLAARVSGKPVVVYPNSGQEWDADARTWRGAPAFGPVGDWVDQGARLIGGCCQVGPAQIRVLATTIGSGPPR
ncbi:homocysteine S-methyltransferase [Amycolatopsis sp. 195334CR]|uniref:homocysteine S-methyltransferase n=1 Tax=Amycolatopsis sp. 195334CR TaxID=2814588 RepID=UPI001A90C23C|nr:homocysteine S-methyltransferase [Amycolatopsis sp. 195334CR]MBN6041885.1 homocysteine S-methyltransferase [Amycolatopsis sp. 195334CR]